jgi:uncharacterized protein GlcG (DUF336 family)
MTFSLVLRRPGFIRSVLGVVALAGWLSLIPTSFSKAEEALVSHKVLSLGTALELAQASLEACRTRGYQVTVAVVDRFGVPQVILRDRYAGAHTPPTATSKAWTAVTFRTSTTDLAAISAPGQPQSGLRQLPNVVVLGGGLPIEAGGNILGGVGVSGAPGGPEDDACASSGIEAVREKLEF